MNGDSDVAALPHTELLHQRQAREIQDEHRESDTGYRMHVTWTGRVAPPAIRSPPRKAATTSSHYGMYAQSDDPRRHIVFVTPQQREIRPRPVSADQVLGVLRTGEKVVAGCALWHVCAECVQHEPSEPQQGGRPVALCWATDAAVATKEGTFAVWGVVDIMEAEASVVHVVLRL
eukprot:CAMPEP_0175958484 /NCGR_PEP_ID=MMETSP0108-20121206/34273_1 /TAXON_ID=195067 ORGANISM="Goniomonas pacifica, Strain CCMP1869" /NCGR_SAMPLE_ID=MMETSP0108 /ASSEMBLY_ACC=CAM_ASM_000204 /LENGTH=174 /DNA_ID=CAMNT_0017285843 /DNA_START=36 /DNA_END=559 /DNA_ORIENTATION=+